MAIKCEAGKLINIAWRHFSFNLLKPEYLRMLEAGTAQEKNQLLAGFPNQQHFNQTSMPEKYTFHLGMLLVLARDNRFLVSANL